MRHERARLRREQMRSLTLAATSGGLGVVGSSIALGNEDFDGAGKKSPLDSKQPHSGSQHGDMVCGRMGDLTILSFC